MRRDKYSRMLAAYDGFLGDRTVKAVLAHVPSQLIPSLTGRELGAVMSAINAAYHAGRASTGAEVEDGAIWINELGKLYELVDIARIA